MGESWSHTEGVENDRPVSVEIAHPCLTGKRACSGLLCLSSPLGCNSLKNIGDCYGEKGLMNEFPEFMKNPLNRVAARSQYTPGIEGYVFEGADGSQMAYWTYSQEAESEPHSHAFDEYLVVIQGTYEIVFDNDSILLAPGDENPVPGGVRHGGHAGAGNRVIYLFGGKRVEREGE